MHPYTYGPVCDFIQLLGCIWDISFTCINSNTEFQSIKPYKKVRPQLSHTHGRHEG